jgi:hypothetical protein
MLTDVTCARGFTSINSITGTGFLLGLLAQKLSMKEVVIMVRILVVIETI